MPAKYISPNFDPTLIISQISLIFSLQYILVIFFTILFNPFFGLKLHIDQILSSDSLDLQSNYGYAYLCSSFFTNLFMIGAYILVIDKANKILDYGKVTPRRCSSKRGSAKFGFNAAAFFRSAIARLVFPTAW